jgi:hypothetical protein
MFNLLTYENQNRTAAVAAPSDLLTGGEALLLAAAFSSLLLSLAATLQTF